MTAGLLLHIISRFIHIASVILLLGGVAYARQVLVPSLNGLPDDLRKQAANIAQDRFRRTLYTLLMLIIVSGFYNFFTYAGPRHSRDYQIWFGVKMLLVAHILATSILWATSRYGDIAVSGKTGRRAASLTIAGLIIVAISAYLRSLTQRGL
ncbi:MAG: hypothetical protein JOZ43_01215 [Acidobacteriales bacterium]|nr:hypothetical protein [Terriglobales bacterium]